jgi:hypothetical protein
MSGQAFNDRVEAFCTRLVDRRVAGSLAAAKGTAELLRQLITSSRLNTPELMLAEVKRVGLRIQAAKPIGGCCATAVRLSAGEGLGVLVPVQLRRGSAACPQLSLLLRHRGWRHACSSAC